MNFLDRFRKAQIQPGSHELAQQLKELANLHILGQDMAVIGPEGQGSLSSRGGLVWRHGDEHFEIVPSEHQGKQKAPLHARLYTRNTDLPDLAIDAHGNTFRHDGVRTKMFDHVARPAVEAVQQNLQLMRARKQELGDSYGRTLLDEREATFDAPASDAPVLSSLSQAEPATPAEPSQDSPQHGVNG